MDQYAADVLDNANLAPQEVVAKLKRGSTGFSRQVCNISHNQPLFFADLNLYAIVFNDAAAPMLVAHNN